MLTERQTAEEASESSITLFWAKPQFLKILTSK
jgi:hypothetical protein